jgi:hypothetical protein
MNRKIPRFIFDKKLRAFFQKRMPAEKKILRLSKRGFDKRSIAAAGCHSPSRAGPLALRPCLSTGLPIFLPSNKRKTRRNLSQTPARKGGFTVADFDLFRQFSAK